MSGIRSVLRPPLRSALHGGDSAQPPFVGPLDLVSTPAVAAWSVARRLTRSYDGPLIRLRRASDNAEMDFGFDDDSVLERDLIEEFLQSSLGTGSVWYDQSGNGHHGQSAVPLSQPDYFVGSEVELPSWMFGGGASSPRFNVAAAEGIDSAFHGGGSLAIIMEMSISTDRILSKGSYLQGWEVSRAGSGIAFVHALETGNAQRSSTAESLISRRALVIATYNGGSSGAGILIYVNGAPVSSYLVTTSGSGLPSIDSAHGLAIGARATTGGNPFVGKILEIVLFGSAIDAEEINVFSSNAISFYALS